MNKTEAERIAAAVNIIQPKWSVPLLMKVLGDERMIRRPYADALLALIACSLDPSTEKPGRVHERGNWWSVVGAVSSQQGPSYREIKPGFCVICGENWTLHGEWSEAYGGHNYENPITDAKGVAPTPEQRAAIDAANVEAQKKVTAEKEAKAAKKVAGVDEVLARHANDEMTTTESRTA